jgi:hypothetical protein
MNNEIWLVLFYCHSEQSESLRGKHEYQFSLLHLEKQGSVFIGPESPAIRFIPMKNRDVRYCQV